MDSSDKPERLLAYDLETSSAETTRLNMVLQFGAVAHNDDLQPVGEFERNSHPGGHYASPGAAAVNNIVPSVEQDSPLSLAKDVAAYIKSCSIEHAHGRNIRLIGYNNRHFDDNVLRRFLFAYGQDPFLIESVGGAPPLDAMRLVVLASVRGSQALKYAEKASGKQSLALADMAEANGISSLEAHDAMADVRMTAQIVMYVHRRDPNLWREWISLHDPESIVGLLEKKEPVALVGAGGHGIYATPMLPLLRHPRRSNAFVGYKLDDPKRLEKLLSLSDDDLAGFYGRDPNSRPVGFRSASAGNVPMRTFKAKSMFVDCMSDLEGGDSALLSAKKKDAALASLQLLRNVGEGRAMRILELSYRDPGISLDEPSKNPEDALHTLRLTTDDISQRMLIADRVLKSPCGVDVADEARRLSGGAADKVTHLRLLSLWKYDEIVMPSIIKGDVEGAKEKLKEYALGESPPPSKHRPAGSYLSRAEEFRLYADTLKLRHSAPEQAGRSMAERQREELACMRERKPAVFFDGKAMDAVDGVGEYNAKMDDVLSFTHALAIALEAKPDARSLPDCLKSYGEAVARPMKTKDLVDDCKI